MIERFSSHEIMLRILFIFAALLIIGVNCDDDNVFNQTRVEVVSDDETVIAATTTIIPLPNEIITEDDQSNATTISPTKKAPPIKFTNGDEEAQVQDLQDQKTIIKKKFAVEENTEKEDLEKKLFYDSCYYAAPEFCEHDNFTADSQPPINCNCKPHPLINDAIICCNVTNIHSSR